MIVEIAYSALCFSWGCTQIIWTFSSSLSFYGSEILTPTYIYVMKINHRDSRERCEICCWWVIYKTLPKSTKQVHETMATHWPVYAQNMYSKLINCWNTIKVLNMILCKLNVLNVLIMTFIVSLKFTVSFQSLKVTAIYNYCGVSNR